MADTTVKWARSTMTGAPALTGQVGSLVSLLDALLVNGWGSQTATGVVVAGGVATATFPSNHAAAPHAVVTVAGITGTYAAMNGDQKVTATGTNTISWATGLANGSAAGTITVKMAGAGWAIPFTGTNLRAYKSSSPQAHGQFLRVSDTAAQVARAVGYENMTAISTGTGLFPSAAQLNGGYYWGKSLAASSAAVPWCFASDGRTFYLFTASGQPGGSPADGTSCVIMAFGDLLPRSPSSDPFASFCVGSIDSLWQNTGTHAVFTSSIDALVSVPRVYGGSGSSFRGTLLARDYDAGSRTLPNPIDGSLGLCPVNYRDGSLAGFVRADLPGLLYGMDGGVEALVPLGNTIRMDGTSRSYLVAHAQAGIETYTSGMRAVALDITGPWR